MSSQQNSGGIGAVFKETYGANLQAIPVDVYDGMEATLDRYIITPSWTFDGLNYVVGLDGNRTKLPAPVAIHGGLGFGTSVRSMFSFRQGTSGGHWWLYDLDDKTVAIDKSTGAEYLLRGSQASGIWTTIQRNDWIYRCCTSGAEMIRYTSAANGTTATSWGIAATTNAPVVANAAGSITTQKTGIAFAHAFAEIVNNQVVHCGTVSPISQPVTASGQSYALSSLDVSSNARVTHKILFASVDGGYTKADANNPSQGILYLLQDGSGNPLTVTNASTTASVDTAQLNYNFAVTAPYYNDVPPLAKHAILYQDRVILWGLPSNKCRVVFSTIEHSFIGIKEESFPRDFNYWDFSTEVVALGICPNGLLLFTVDEMYLLSGQITDTIPDDVSTVGQTNLQQIPTISASWRKLGFGVGTASPFSLANDPGGALWFLSSDLKVYGFDGSSTPQEQGSSIRGTETETTVPCLLRLDQSKKPIFFGSWLNWGNRTGYALLCHEV